MIKGKSILIPLPRKKKRPYNSTRLTRLPMMWKMLTAQVKEDISNSLARGELFPEEQKGWHKEKRGIMWSIVRWSTHS